MMKLEVVIIIAVWVLSMLILFFIPSHKKRIGFIAFFFKQFITWPIGLLTVELHMIKYPIRCLADVNRTSFLYEYMAFPAVCALFNAYYPEHRGMLFKILYYTAYTSVLTGIEIILEKYTDVIEYISWSARWTFVTLWITFMMTRFFCVWFFRLKTKTRHG
jgi:hypothetical protein